MNRIDVTKLEFLKIEPRGRGVKEKFWIQQGETQRLVKISSPNTDQDVMEYLSSIILKELGIPCVSVSLGYDAYSKMNCCLVDNFLQKEGDVSYEMVGWKLLKGKNFEDELQLCLNQVFDKYSSLYNIKDTDLFNIKREYIRILFGKCIIGNFDAKLENIGVIYNEKEDSYRLPPSFDNGFAFKDFKSFADPICFIGNQFFGIFPIIDYLIQYYYEDIKDIIIAFEIFISTKLEIVLQNLESEITLEKRNYIMQYLKDVHERLAKINSKIK